MFTRVVGGEHVKSISYQYQTLIEASCLALLAPSPGLDELHVWLVAHHDECLQATNCDFHRHLQLGCSLAKNKNDPKQFINTMLEMEEKSNNILNNKRLGAI